MTIEASEVRIAVPLRLVPTGDIPQSALDDRAARWEVTAERIWGGFSLHVRDRALPIHVDVTLQPANDATEVAVTAGAGPADAHAWRLDNPPEVAAHEVGHLLGAWDEYGSGSLNPTTRQVDPATIMGRERPDAVALPRHLDTLARWLSEQLGAECTVTGRSPPG